jgi:hypothetical protein
MSQDTAPHTSIFNSFGLDTIVTFFSVDKNEALASAAIAEFPESLSYPKFALSRDEEDCVPMNRISCGHGQGAEAASQSAGPDAGGLRRHIPSSPNLLNLEEMIG